MNGMKDDQFLLKCLDSGYLKLLNLYLSYLFSKLFLEL
jgi:hypothetical protein